MATFDEAFAYCQRQLAADPQAPYRGIRGIDPKTRQAYWLEVHREGEARFFRENPSNPQHPFASLREDELPDGINWDFRADT